MSQINLARYKYTPDEMDENEFLKRFVARNEIFEDIFKELKSTDYALPCQHYILVGQRGQGKTTLLRKIFIETQRDAGLSSFLLPIKFAEEQYQIRSLCRLWEEVADYLQSLYPDEFGAVLSEMEKRFEDDEYDLECFSMLESALKSKNKKLLLLIDNIDELMGKLSDKEQRRLREILMSSASFRIIGGSTKMLEQHYDYGKPFYQFFKIIKLQEFGKEETIRFLQALGTDVQKEKIDAVIQNTPERIETLRRLTSGVPRTIAMLFDIFVHSDDGNAFDDLLKILDEVTPLYKHRMDDLPHQLQDIVHAVAMNWDGMPTKDIAQKTRLESKIVSAQLKQLEKYEIVESESIGKNKIYKIKERFFNIWYLMRFGRKKDRQRVEWLVKFLQSWCSREELNERAKSLTESIKNGSVSPNQAFHMTEALGYTGGLDMATEHYLKVELKKFLELRRSELANELSESDNELLQNAIKEDEAYNHGYALFLLNKIKNPPQETINYKTHLENGIKKYGVIFLGAYYALLGENFDVSYSKFIEYLHSEEVKGIRIFGYIVELIAKGQLYQAKKFFEMPEFELKERFKPLWYALMTLMQKEFPEEIKKMGSELQESVDEILKQIEDFKSRSKNK